MVAQDADVPEAYVGSSGPNSIAPSDATRTGELRDVYAKYVGEYRDRWAQSNRGNKAISSERDAVIATVASQLAPAGFARVLDVGCGEGTHLPPLDAGLRVGIDLLIERLVRSISKWNLVNGDGVALPFPNASFDACVLSTVLTSVLDADIRAAVAREVDRVLVAGGVVLWYDFRYPNPRNTGVAPVSRRHINELFPGYEKHLRPVTLLPPLARRLGPLTNLLYPFLVRVPPLCSHLAGALVKPYSGRRHRAASVGPLTTEKDQ